MEREQESLVDQKTEEEKKTEVEVEPNFWRLKDFKGFIHFHSWDGSSCGTDRLARIKEAITKKTGLTYIGFTEHVGCPDAEYWPEKIKSEFSKIDQLNQENTSPYFFKGVEANVLPDGRLDASLEELEQSDIIVAAFHYKNTDRPEEMTAENTINRWCRVMDQYPAVNVLGHPLRDLPEEEWESMDWDKLCSKAKEKNVAIEFTISDHMDQMPAEFFRALREHDNLVSVSLDFHSLGRYLLEEGDLNQEQQELIKEYSKARTILMEVSFNYEELIRRGEAVETVAIPPDLVENLKQLKTKLEEIEAGEELGEIYEILSSNIKYKTDKEDVVSAEKRPLSYKMLIKFARKINQLRKPIDDSGEPAIPKSNIINLWGKDKFADWIKTRKAESEIKKEIQSE